MRTTGHSQDQGPHPWVEAVAVLWPGARVDLVRSSLPLATAGTGGDRGGDGDVTGFAFLPDAERPRLLLPGSPGAAAAALRRYSHDLTIPQRVTRSLTATALRTGLPQRMLRDRLRIVTPGTGGAEDLRGDGSGGGEGDGGRESIEEHLSGLLGRAVVVSVSLGTVRANRKPILHVLTPSGRQVAFVKVGDTPTACGLVEREAAALRFLAGHPMPGVAVPRVLHHGPWNGMTLLVLSPLPTSALGRRPRRSVPVAAMRALFEVAGATTGTLADSAFWARIRGVPARLSDPEQAGRLSEAIDRVDREYGGQPLEFGAWHGDWTPWNMAWHRGTVQLWDLERFDSGVPAGLDLLHWRLQQAMRGSAGRTDASWPAEAVRALAAFGVTGRAARATVELYLLELCCRYLPAVQGPLGATALRAQADRLLALLAVGIGPDPAPYSGPDPVPYSGPGSTPHSAPASGQDSGPDAGKANAGRTHDHET